MSAPRVIFGITTGVGASSYFRGLFSYLREDGFDVTFLAQDEAGAREFAEGEGATFRAITAEREPSPATDLRTFVDLCRALRSRSYSVAVWGTPKVGLLGCLASRVTGTRSVYVVHGLRYQGAVGIGRKLLGLAEKLTIFLADEVIAVGSEIAECLVADKITRNRPTLLAAGSANGVLAPERVDREGSRNQLIVPLNNFVVGFVGRLTHDKGVLELLEAWKVFAQDKEDVILLVAGAREPDSFEGDLGRAVKTVEKVKWLGHVENPSTVYSAMDVLVLPSKREGLPAVVMEASAHAKPVIASNRPGVGEAVEDGVTGFVVSCETPHAMVEKLELLYSSDQLGKELGANGRRHIIEKYGRSKVHAAWSSFLKVASERAE